MRQASAGASMIPTGRASTASAPSTHDQNAVAPLDQQERADREHEEQALGVDHREDERERRDREVEHRAPRDRASEQVVREPVQHAQPDREEQRRERGADQSRSIHHVTWWIAHRQAGQSGRNAGVLRVEERRVVALQRDLPVPDRVPHADGAEQVVAARGPRAGARG